MAGRQRRPPGCESSCLGAQMPDDMRLLFREQTNAFAWLACWATDSCLTEIKNVTRGTAASAEGFTFSRNGFGKVPRLRIWPLIYSPRTRTWVNCCRSPGSGGRAADTRRDPLSGPSPSPASDRPGRASSHRRARGKGPLVPTVQSSSILPLSEKKKITVRNKNYLSTSSIRYYFSGCSFLGRWVRSPKISPRLRGDPQVPH